MSEQKTLEKPKAEAKVELKKVKKPEKTEAQKQAASIFKTVATRKPSEPPTNKRAFAVALFEVAMDRLQQPQLAAQIAAKAFVVAGSAYCQRSGTSLVGEVRGEKGATGYIKIDASWWKTLAGKNHDKVQAERPLAEKYLPKVTDNTPEKRFAALEAHLKGMIG